MKITMEPTNEIQPVNGCDCRIWNGTNENGTPIKLYVAVLQPQTHDPAQLEMFDRELKAMPEPRRSVVVTDLRFIL